ncbi:MAG: PEP-CTERM sorting domain-containing protein [Pseudomonadota bacterium]
MVRLRLFICLLFGVCALPAAAETATFVSPATLSPNEIGAVSTRGDREGVTVSRSASLQLLFNEPFGATLGDRISIFTLRPDSAFSFAIGTVRVGVYDNGNVTYLGQGNFLSGRRVNISNLFRGGCGAFGGCNFIEILTQRTGGGAEGVRVDYVQLNGEVVSVAAPTPEPSSWALMIAAFGVVAWRCKTTRNRFTQAAAAPSEAKQKIGFVC